MPNIPPDLTKLEATLAGLLPAAAGLNRDRLIYEAGRRSLPRRRGWPAAAVLFAGLSLALGFQSFLRPEPPPRVVEIVKLVPAPAPSTAQMPSAPEPAVVVRDTGPRWGHALRSAGGYLSLRDQVLYFGADSLRPLPPSAAPLTHAAPLVPRRADRELFPFLSFFRAL